MKLIAVVCLMLPLFGCASHGNAVRCDGRLQPVNAPASAREGVPARTADTAAVRNRE